ncbi:MAG TPA: GAF domain-containing protein [Candidatus Obscuribacterales bacterium]
MDAASAFATLMVEPWTSHLPSPVKPFFLQEHAAAQMQYSADPTQIERQIAQIILSSPDLETVLQKIARALGETFQVDACWISANPNYQAALLTVNWSADSYSAMLIEDEAHLLETLALGDVEAISEPVAISDINAADTGVAVTASTQTLPIRALLRIPTWFQGQQNGVIVIGRSLPYTWTQEEKELLKVVSQPVAIAISQVQLHLKVRTLTQHQTLITQLTMAIRSTFDLDQILHQAIATTAQALQVDRGLLLLLKYVDPLFNSHPLHHLPKAKATVVGEWFSSNKRSNTPSEQENPNTFLNYSFGLSDCHWCQQAFTDAPKPVAITDRRTLSPVDSGCKMAWTFAPEVMPALLMVPLENQGTVLGFLVLQHSQPRRWQPEELDLVKWVSAQASTTIIQSQTLHQVQALVEERTAQLQSSLELQAKLYEKTRQQIDQLRHLNQLKDEFLSTMSHELRTPLTNMAMAIRLLRQPELPTERRAKYLDILDQQCTQEINLINDLLTLQDLESNHSPINPIKVDLKGIITDLAESFKQKWADKRLTLAVDLPKRSLMLQTDPDSLSRMLLELLTNAGKYSEPDTTVHLRVTHQVTEQVEQIILTLCNTGLCISLTELKYIFDKFRRGEGVTEKAIPGTGLGLALVKCLVQHLNGTIDVKSCPIGNSQSCETCFTLTLPQIFDSGKV